MYHSHHDEMTQMALGMLGLFIIHPRTPTRPRPDRDFAFILSEWKITPGTSRPDPNEMTDFNIFTFNAKAFPGTAPLVAKRGDKVRIRLANANAMSHHPIHLHGYQFKITETDGGQIPESAQWPETSVLTPIGTTRTFDFVADAPGDWAIHCHMTHHVMNQMGHGCMIGRKSSRPSLRLLLRRGLNLFGGVLSKGFVRTRTPTTVVPPYDGLLNVLADKRHHVVEAR